MINQIATVLSENLAQLQKISMETFADTFGADNTQEDLDKYLQSAYNIKELQSELENSNSSFQFIYYHDALAGYLKTNVGDAQTELQDQNGLEIERIYIKKQFKRLGLGKQLIALASQQAQIKQKNFLWLGVWENNAPAISFYNKQGFTAFSEHLFKLGNDPQRDILMRKDIIQK